MVKPSRAIRPTVSTSICRSATLIRSCSVSTSSSSSHGHRRLGDDRAGVDPLVDDEQRRAGDLDAVRQRVRRSRRPGERRAQRRVGVDHAAGEPAEELRTDQLHEAGQHHQVGLEGRHRVGQGRCPSASRLVNSADLVDEGRHAGRLGAGQALDAVAVGADGDHRGAVRRVRARVEQRLEVGAGAGDEDDESRRNQRAPGQATEQRGSVRRQGRRRRPGDPRRRCHQAVTTPATSPPRLIAATAETSTSPNGAPMSAIRPVPIGPPASAIATVVSSAAPKPQPKPRRAAESYAVTP